MKKNILIIVFIFYSISITFGQVSFEKVTNPHEKLFRIKPYTYSMSNPVFADLDNDNDLDMVSIHGVVGFAHFENVDGLFTPLSLNDAFFSLPIGSDAMFAFYDHDNDGDLDIFSSSSYGYSSPFDYYENLGNGEYSLISSYDPFINKGVGGQRAAPAFVDFDNDNDIDIVCGFEEGIIVGLENVGGEFTFNTIYDGPFAYIDVGEFATPAFADLDNDGDLDLVCGNKTGEFHYFQNDNGDYNQKTGVNNPFEGIDMKELGGYSTPAFADLDNDGDLDLVSGNKEGTFEHYENDKGEFVLREEQDSPLGGFKLYGGLDHPTFVDYDNDNDLDLVVGDLGFDNDGSPYTIKYFQNDDNLFVEKKGVENPFSTLESEKKSTPKFVDFDKDGDLDIISGTSDGHYNYFENDNGVYIKTTGADNPFSSLNPGIACIPELLDFDNDGDLDLISTKGSYDLEYYQNESGTFSLTSGTADPFDGFYTYSRFNSPKSVDLDNDGDLDIVGIGMVGVGDDGVIQYLENNNGVLRKITGSDNPFYYFSHFNGYLTFADLDGDNDLDLVVIQHGDVYEYRNTTDNIIASSKDSKFENNLVIYPNPADDFINIISSDKNIKSSIANINGQIIINETKKKIDVSSLKAGIYFLKYKVYGKSYQNKIIVK